MKFEASLAQKVCTITDKPVEESSEGKWDDVRAKRTLDTVKERVKYAKDAGALGEA